MKKLGIIFGIVTLCLMSIIIVDFIEINELQNKVDFYETVMEDFDISEFIDYPELYYEDGYTEQVKTHNCMWSIEQTIDCENKLYECEKDT